MVTRGASYVPESDTTFRLAQLLLLLRTLAEIDDAGSNLERLGYYDFLSANPFLVAEILSGGRAALIMAGFDDRAISYASAGHRFTSRRERLQHDLSLLISFNFAVAHVASGSVMYTITPLGIAVADGFQALYARAYTRSATLVINSLRRMSDTRLRTAAREWLRAPDTLLDLMPSAYDWAAED